MNVNIVVPDDLHQRAKIRAIIEKMTLRDFIVKVLEEYLERDEKKKK